MTGTISDLSTLEEHFDEPLEAAVAVMRESLDKYQRQFIELSPFACIATADASGQPTISPKGDAPGFGTACPRRNGFLVGALANDDRIPGLQGGVRLGDGLPGRGLLAGVFVAALV